MEQDSVGPNHQSPIKVCVGVKFSKSSREKSMDNSMLDSKVKKDYHTFISVEDDVTLKLQPVQHLQSCNCEVCFANQGSALSRSLSRSFSMEQSSLSVSRSFTKEKSYKFSRVFTDTHKSQDLFNFVKDDVLSVLQGYNCTVFTYGPPASGKSSMLYGGGAQTGIVQKAISQIFDVVNKRRSYERQYSIELSFIELHNNSFRNLLKTHIQDINTKRGNAASSPIRQEIASGSKITSSPKSNHNRVGRSFDSNTSPNKPKQLQLHGIFSELSDRIDLRTECIFSSSFRISSTHSSSSNGVNLTVYSEQEALGAITAGRKRVTPSDSFTGITASKSHLILTVFVETRQVATNQEVEKGGQVLEYLHGKLQFIDLAPSDHTLQATASNTDKAAVQSVPTQNSTQKTHTSQAEFASINLSLLTLGKVLQRLAANQASTQSSTLPPSTSLRSHSPKSSASRPMAASRDNQPCSPDVPAATDATSTAQRQNNTHVPFLDSKLTTLLRDSLGGNCHTVMLAALRRDGVPSVEADVRHEMYKQAVGCLNMATTAGKIVNRPVRNFTRTVESVVDNIPTIRVIESSCGITTMKEKYFTSMPTHSTDTTSPLRKSASPVPEKKPSTPVEKVIYKKKPTPTHLTAADEADKAAPRSSVVRSSPVRLLTRSLSEIYQDEKSATPRSSLKVRFQCDEQQPIARAPPRESLLCKTPSAGDEMDLSSAHNRKKLHTQLLRDFLDAEQRAMEEQRLLEVARSRYESLLVELAKWDQTDSSHCNGTSPEKSSGLQDNAHLGSPETDYSDIYNDIEMDATVQFHPWNRMARLSEETRMNIDPKILVSTTNEKENLLNANGMLENTAPVPNETKESAPKPKSHSFDFETVLSAVAGRERLEQRAAIASRLWEDAKSSVVGAASSPAPQLTGGNSSVSTPPRKAAHQNIECGSLVSSRIEAISLSTRSLGNDRGAVRSFPPSASRLQQMRGGAVQAERAVCAVSFARSCTEMAATELAASVARLAEEQLKLQKDRCDQLKLQYDGLKGQVDADYNLLQQLYRANSSKCTTPTTPNRKSIDVIRFGTIDGENDMNRSNSSCLNSAKSASLAAGEGEPDALLETGSFDELSKDEFLRTQMRRSTLKMKEDFFRIETSDADTKPKTDGLTTKQKLELLMKTKSQRETASRKTDSGELSGHFEEELKVALPDEGEPLDKARALRRAWCRMEGVASAMQGSIASLRQELLLLAEVRGGAGPTQKWSLSSSQPPSRRSTTSTQSSGGGDSFATPSSSVWSLSSCSSTTLKLLPDDDNNEEGGGEGGGSLRRLLLALSDDCSGFGDFGSPVYVVDAARSFSSDGSNSFKYNNNNNSIDRRSGSDKARRHSTSSSFNHCF